MTQSDDPELIAEIAVHIKDGDKWGLESNRYMPDYAIEDSK